MIPDGLTSCIHWQAESKNLLACLHMRFARRGNRRREFKSKFGVRSGVHLSVHLRSVMRSAESFSREKHLITASVLRAPVALRKEAKSLFSLGSEGKLITSTQTPGSAGEDRNTRAASLWEADTLMQTCACHPSSTHHIFLFQFNCKQVVTLEVCGGGSAKSAADSACESSALQLMRENTEWKMVCNCNSFLFGSFWKPLIQKKKKKTERRRTALTYGWGQDTHSSKRKTFFYPTSIPKGTGVPSSSSLYHHLNISSGETSPWNNFNKADLSQQKVNMSSSQFCRLCLDFYKSHQTRLFSPGAELCSLCNLHSFTIWQNLSLWNHLLRTICLPVIIQPLRLRSLEWEQALKEYFKLMDWNLRRGSAWGVRSCPPPQSAYHVNFNVNMISLNWSAFFWSWFEKKEDLILKFWLKLLTGQTKMDQQWKIQAFLFLKPAQALGLQSLIRSHHDSVTDYTATSAWPSEQGSSIRTLTSPPPLERPFHRQEQDGKGPSVPKPPRTRPTWN